MILSSRTGVVCLYAAAVIACSLSGGTRGAEFFFDDFEDYVDPGLGIPTDENLEAAGWQIVNVNDSVTAPWTVTNPRGHRNPPTEDGTPSTGSFVISISDLHCCDGVGSGKSQDLWSPAIETGGAAVVWLHFDCSSQMNNNGLVVFDVDVSTDGGANWTNVFRRVAPARGGSVIPVSATNADGFFGRLHLNVSPQVGGRPSFQFRLRQFESDDDWWVAADNVLVDDQPVEGGSTIIFGREDFSGGIPATWTLRSLVNPPNTGLATWTTADPCGRKATRYPPVDDRSVSRLRSPFAIMDSECNLLLPYDEYLITPAVDCTAATGVFLHLKSETVVSEVTTQEVLLSLDGGQSFEGAPIFTYSNNVTGDNALFDGGEDPFFAERIFSVPAASGESRVAFAFHHESPGPQNPDDHKYWAVDDVKVSANGTFPPQLTRACANREFTAGEFDPASVSVTTSWRSIPGDEGFRILANGTVVSGAAPLPAGTTSFTHSNPAAGGTITYTLQSLIGGSVERECSAPPILVVACPRELTCCPDPAARMVNLSWTNGVNIAGSGWRITRNGLPVRTVPLSQNTFTDTVPAPGVYNYQLILNGGDLAQCPELPLRCKATVIGGDILFSDEFECYADDTELVAAGWEIREENSPLENAAWTMLDRASRGNPPTRDGTATLGKFIISDSDIACCEDATGSGMSHDIWSPSFSTLGQSTVWLHAAVAAVLNNNGKVVFDIDVSTNNGTSWTNVFRRVAPTRTEAEPFVLADIPEDLPNGPQVGNADAFFGPLDVDISAAAANKASVRLRFRQFEPHDDWWIAFDDVLVDTKPLRGGNAVILATEGFDDGLIPNTWGIESRGEGLAPWRAEDICQISLLNMNGGMFPDGADGLGLHHMDTAFAHLLGDEFCQAQAQDEYLLTPVLDLSAATNVYLHFKSALVLGEHSVPEVLLSVDGGKNFDLENPLFSYQRSGGALRDSGGNGEMYYNEYIFSVPAAIGKNRTVFAFHFLNLTAEPVGWAIDDVQVTADVPAAGVGPFKRGDCNQDGANVGQVTDGVYLLNFIFLGGPRPICLAACDMNGDGSVAGSPTDAIYFFNFNFLGGPPIPEPLRDCAVSADPEDMALGCADPGGCT